jgi:hypothetical protein
VFCPWPLLFLSFYFLSAKMWRIASATQSHSHDVLPKCMEPSNYGVKYWDIKLIPFFCVMSISSNHNHCLFVIQYHSKCTKFKIIMINMNFATLKIV